MSYETAVIKAGDKHFPIFDGAAQAFGIKK